MHFATTVQEKCDHIGIVFTIVGTAVTALMAQEHGHAPPAMVAIAAGLLVAACLQPVPRVTGFIVGGGLLGKHFYTQWVAVICIPARADLMGLCFLHAQCFYTPKNC